MKKTGAALARFALEQLGVKYTFGIPGVHNTELYDELNSSESIQPVLVTHECGAAFMADAVSRTSDSIGTLVIVPAAGVTHAASGIGEAGLDGIPMLIISGGIHSESPYRYQLHDIDQHSLLAPITKATFRIAAHHEVIPTLYEAYRIATGGEPGPVFVELPYNIGNFLGEVDEMPAFEPIKAPAELDMDTPSPSRPATDRGASARPVPRLGLDRRAT
jgi:acetolactate synthase-1/2/3 large subunit